eukprot:scaffold6642_cov101-Isochrysis_galbana.AAC.4
MTRSAGVHLRAAARASPQAAAALARPRAPPSRRREDARQPPRLFAPPGWRNACRGVAMVLALSFTLRGGCYLAGP